MRVCKTGHILVFQCKIGKISENLCRLLENDFRRMLQNDNIRVVADIARGCTEMDYRLCFRTLLSVCVYMRHYIVTHNFFAFLRNLIIHIVAVCFQLRNLLIGNSETKLLFGFCKSNPKPAPCSEFELLRKDFLHFGACVPC